MQESGALNRIWGLLRNGPRAPRTSDRTIRILIGCSLSLWLLWALARPVCHPFGDLTCGYFTDHFSDMNVARLLASEGLDVWQRPLGELGQPLTESEITSLPPDIRSRGDDAFRIPGSEDARKIPGWPEDKPFLSSWEHLPSYSSPGGLALSAPVAALYHFTSISFTQANKALIALFLVYAHLSLYVFFRSLARIQPGVTRALAGFAVYGETIQFTLLGFSEAAVMGPLLMSACSIHRKDGLKGMAWFALALSFHFRALFFFPMFIYSAFLVIRERQWHDWRAPAWITGAVTLAMGGFTLFVICLLLPSLTATPITNAANLKVLWGQEVAIPFVGMLVILATLLARAEAWPDLILLVWIFVIFTLLREAYPWNVVSLFAWLAMPIAGHNRHIVRDVRFVAIMFGAVVVLKHDIFSIPIWIEGVI